MLTDNYKMNDKQVDKNLKVYPFIDELVDSLYTDELNRIIDSENVQFDKRTFLIFIIIMPIISFILELF